MSDRGRIVGPVLAPGLQAAATDTRIAVREFDGARGWLARALANPGQEPMAPLAAEVWVFDLDLRRVLLVRHRWRGWVPPGGSVEPAESPRQAAVRELAEETGLHAQVFALPAAVAVRAYRRDWSATLGLSYATIVDPGIPLVAENGQPAAWTPLHQDWASFFPADPDRIRWHARWLTQARTGPGRRSPGVA